jgi:DNA-binding FadR family transcriptional regulator
MLELVQDLPIGSSLPAEGTLAEKFGVSRLTVREALKVLEGRGLTETRQGRRAVVTEPSSEIISSIFASYVYRDPTALLELVEVRQALEARSVSLAASKATRAGLGAMEASLRTMKESAEVLGLPGATQTRWNQARAAFQQSDLAFHEAVALASGNRMLAHVLEALADSLLQAFNASFDGNVLRGGSAIDTYETHLHIYEFIKARDARGASIAMRKNLQQSQKDLRAYIARTTVSVTRPEAPDTPETAMYPSTKTLKKGTNL